MVQRAQEINLGTVRVMIWDTLEKAQAENITNEARRAVEIRTKKFTDTTTITTIIE